MYVKLGLLLDQHLSELKIHRSELNNRNVHEAAFDILHIVS